MAAAADPAKTARFRDRFARVAFNVFAITRPIYVFQGARWIVRRNMRLVRTLPINEGSRWLSNHDWSVCGGESVVNLTADDLMLPSSPMAKV
jgi:hypothetical protein